MLVSGDWFRLKGRVTSSDYVWCTPGGTLGISFNDEIDSVRTGRKTEKYFTRVVRDRKGPTDSTCSDWASTLTFVVSYSKKTVQSQGFGCRIIDVILLLLLFLKSQLDE